MDRNLARAVTDKKPVPEIDFTLHTMEDGTQVSTQERVVKGMHTLKQSIYIPVTHGFATPRGASTRPKHPLGRVVLVS